MSTAEDREPVMRFSQTINDHAPSACCEQHLRAAISAGYTKDGLDVERLIEAMRPVTRHLVIGGGDTGYERWLRDTASSIADGYTALVKP